MKICGRTLCSTPTDLEPDGSLSCHTQCDQGSRLALPRKDRLSQVGLYEKQETLRTYSNSDPHCTIIFFKSACHQFSLLILFLRTGFSLK